MVGDAVVHVVFLGPRGDHQQGLALAVPAEARDICQQVRLSGWLRKGRREGRSAARLERASSRIFRDAGLIDDRVHGVVVPAIGVIVGDDDRRFLPFIAGHDRVDRLHDEGLFVEWIGIARVAVRIGGGLEEAYGGHMAMLQGLEEFRQDRTDGWLGPSCQSCLMLVGGRW